MSRGNQRDRDRERAQARNSGKTKNSKNDGLTPEQRRERDAKALQEKAARKAHQASGGEIKSGELYTRLDDITSGSTIRVRIIRMFKRSMYPTSTKTPKPGLELILMDDKGSKIEAHVRSYLCWKWANVLKEFSCVIITGFGLIDCKGSFRFSTNPQKISFLPGTVVTACPMDLTIPKYGFHFADFVAILADILDTSFLIDIIGELIEYGDVQTITRDGVAKQMINIKLEDHNNNIVRCTLWGEFATQISEYLSDSIVGRVIVVMQFVKVGIYQGEIYISNTLFGTRLLLDQSIPEIIEYKKSHTDKDGDSSSRTISHVSGQATKDLASFFLLPEAIKKLSEIQEIKGTCVYVTLATIVEIEDKLNWFYNSCKKCKKGVETDGEHFFCLQCDKHCDFPVLRYRLQLKVADETGYSSFVMFDHDVQSVVKKSVKTLREEQNNAGDMDSFPELLNVFLEKTFLFRYEISEYYSTKGKKSHTIKKMTEDVDIIEQFKAIKSSSEVMQSDFSDSDNTPDVAVGTELITPQKRPVEVVDVEEEDAVNTRLSSTKLLRPVKIEKVDV